MSRHGRSSADDLAYGDFNNNNRWDRDRFDRFGRGPPQPPQAPKQFEEDYHFLERDRPGHHEVMIEDRIESRGPRARVDDRERIFQETFGERPRRRTDRELFGDVDPRDIAEMAMTPFKKKGSIYGDPDAPQGRGARPGLLRRQSSLDTFNRRPIPRYDREDNRIPPYTPVPLPIRKQQEELSQFGRGEESYREVEVKRERSVHRRGGKKSKAPTVLSSSSSSSTLEEVIEKSSSPQRPGFKKGKTRMPKRLVPKEAIQDLGYPYIEEENFYIVQIALEKEQIDEVMRISETYKSDGKRKTFEEKISTEEDERTVRGQSHDRGGREEIIRKEYINPPSDFLGTQVSRRSRSSRRAHSPSVESSISQRSPARSAHTSHSRARSGYGENRRRSRAPSAVLPGPEFFEERKTVIEERGPLSHLASALVLQERETRSDRDIQSEIRSLEAERRALRLEREAEEKHNLAVRIREHRPDEEFQLVEYREERPRHEVLEIVERERSPPRNVLRVEKDRKVRRGPNPKLVAAAMTTLT